jgi:uncharacterized protein (DUF2141 family)
MKTIRTLFFALILITFSGYSQDTRATLKINFSTQGKKGILYVAVYDSSDNFMKVKLKKTSVDMSSGENAQLKIEDLIIGKDYAITSFLDENANLTLDKNAFGIPNEPYGFSNNTKGFFGPPSYDDVKIIFTVKDNPISIIVD